MRIFISHADDARAVELERLLRRATNEEALVFNSGRWATGIAAGQLIDTTLLESISRSDAVIWMVSPESVSRSFWMAWELGVADANSKPVYPCRTLGIGVRDLPLLQERRQAPDLGTREGLTALLSAVCSAPKAAPNSIAEAVEEFYQMYPVATPFDATSDSALSIVIAGSRMIVESAVDEKMENLTFISSDPEMAKALQRIQGLDPRGRRITAAPTTQSSDEVTARWMTSGSGRRWQSLRVTYHS